MKGEKKGASPLNTLKVTSTGGEGACNIGGGCNHNGCLPLCLQLGDQNQQLAIRAQIPNIWRTGCCGPSWLPQATIHASGSRNTCTAACQMVASEERVAATVLRAEID